jgi:hypothetical protein
LTRDVSGPADQWLIAYRRLALPEGRTARDDASLCLPSDHKQWPRRLH